MRLKELGAGAVLTLLVLAAVSQAAADPGEAAILGQFNTAGKKTTTIWANTNGATLKVRQARPGQPALILDNDGSAAPMVVNSSGLVSGLNADLLDGYDASSLIRADWCMMDREGTDPLLTDFTCRMDITAPGPGVLLMSGSIDISKRSTGGDLLWCAFWLDGTEVPGTQRTIDVHADHDQETNCASDGAVVVGAGDHIVRFKVKSVNNVRLFDSTSYVLFVPFGGDGGTLP